MLTKGLKCSVAIKLASSLWVKCKVGFIYIYFPCNYFTRLSTQKFSGSHSLASYTYSEVYVCNYVWIRTYLYMCIYRLAWELMMVHHFCLY